MREWLPLFPLQAVLLPGAELPLHIFEERYKEMIREVMKERLEFGVVLASDKGILSTGCTATVDRLLREYPDGRMDILTTGRRRFEILRLNEERAFLRGAIEFFDDEDAAAPAAESRRQAIAAYNELLSLSSQGPLEPAEAVDPQLSFRLARTVTDLNTRQTLLAMRSEADRIRQLAAFLPGYLIRERRVQHVKQVAPRNGHGRTTPEIG
ncbi:MAG TPA: LON peptidase substrate-binding domain-containing protein [Bryobacteraceae bacterium]|nr:LON peptidase substrate-binding domain-containing protein [Bryobacteraceae bacterium]